jgi:osmotically-inducible protein OsmY
MRNNRREREQGRYSDQNWSGQDRESQGRFHQNEGNRRSRTMSERYPSHNLYEDRNEDRDRDFYDQGNYGRGGYGSYNDNLGNMQRGYGNDPDSFANSNSRSGYSSAWRGYRNDDKDRNQNSGTWGFGRSWNRSEDFGNENEDRGFQNRNQNLEGFGQNRNYGQNQNSGNWNTGSSSWNRSAGNRNQNEDTNFQSNFGYGSNESFRGKGPKGYQRSDERIQEDINDRLSDDDSVDASDIEVKVEKGEVTLSGKVSDRNAKRRAEDVVEMISGVKNVENRIRVSEGSESESKEAFPKSPSQTQASKSNDRSKIRESIA